MHDISEILVWWVTLIDLPALSTLFWLIWRTRREQEQTAAHMREIIEARNAQMREALSSFKLEVAKSYASISDMKEIEARLIAYLLRIESKLDATAMKTEAISAKNQ